MPRCVILIRRQCFCITYNPTYKGECFSLLSPAAARSSSALFALSNSQQKATFDLGSILLCLTAEHLNTRQVVFMTHRLKLLRSTLEQQDFFNRSLWTNYSFVSWHKLEDNEVHIGLLDPWCNCLPMLYKLLWKNFTVIFCTFWKSYQPIAATVVFKRMQTRNYTI